MDWQLIAPEFERDGSLRDIYVLETSIAEWQKMWDSLRELQPPPAFSINGVAEPMPEKVATIFANRSEFSPLLSIRVGQMLLNCHFFQDDEIEFDCDPREINGPQAAEALGTFMQMLGDITHRSVILTHENMKDATIARYSAGVGGVIWGER